MLHSFADTSCSSFPYGLYKRLFSCRRMQVCASQYPNWEEALSFSSAMPRFPHLPSLTWFSQHLTVESEMETARRGRDVRTYPRTKQTVPLPLRNARNAMLCRSGAFSEGDFCYDINHIFDAKLGIGLLKTPGVWNANSYYLTECELS